MTSASSRIRILATATLSTGSSAATLPDDHGADPAETAWASQLLGRIEASAGAARSDHPGQFVGARHVVLALTESR